VAIEGARLIRESNRKNLTSLAYKTKLACYCTLRNNAVADFPWLIW
jgi:hypothetical protein